MVVDQSEASVSFVFRSVVGRPGTALVLVSDDPQHEGFGVADDGPQGGAAVDCLTHLLKDLHLL